MKHYALNICLPLKITWKQVNQVIYTEDTICVPNIMILAQMLLQIFFWQGSTGLQCMLEKADNSAKYLQNFAKG